MKEYLNRMMRPDTSEKAKEEAQKKAKTEKSKVRGETKPRDLSSTRKNYETR